MLNEDFSMLPNGAKIFRGAVINLKPIATNTTARKIPKEFVDTEIGENTIIYPNAVVYANVKIGKNCLICSGVVIREGCTIGDNCLIANNVTINYNAWVGDNVKIMDNSHITGGIYIGNNVFISCLVATSNDNSMGNRKGESCRPPMIFPHAKIGAGANILPGVIIKQNSIVAAGAVVTHDVPPNVTVMGIPAKVKK